MDIFIVKHLFEGFHEVKNLIQILHHRVFCGCTQCPIVVLPWEFYETVRDTGKLK